MNVSLSSFPGLHSRFETIGTVNGIRVVSDHSAHPAEIQATIQMAKQTGAKKIIAVHQPSWRTPIVEGYLEEYAVAFEGADHVVIGQGEVTGPAPGSEAHDMLVNYLQSHGLEDIIPMPDSAKLPEIASKFAGDGDIVLCLGYLTTDRWARELVRYLEEQKAT